MPRIQNNHQVGPQSYSSIMATMLRISSGDGGAGKLSIMSGASLSFEETAKFLFLLKENGMIAEERRGEQKQCVYRTTTKGTIFLSTLESLREVQVSSRI